jgi:hypothetical protein
LISFTNIPLYHISAHQIPAQTKWEMDYAERLNFKGIPKDVETLSRGVSTNLLMKF